MKKRYIQFLCLWVGTMLIPHETVYGDEGINELNVNAFNINEFNTNDLDITHLIKCKNRAINISRNSFGVPNITGGTFEEVCRAIGYVQAQDRLWQIFLFNIVGNGRLSEYVGAGTDSENVASDIFQRQTNPTDAEIQDQIDNYFDEQTLIAYQNFVIGLNNRVAEVNLDPAILPYELKALGFYPGVNPVHFFTLYDILRTNKFLLNSFSGTSLPFDQLSNLTAFDTFSTQFGPVNALDIFNDVDPTSHQIKSKSLVARNKEVIPFISYAKAKGVKQADDQKESLLINDPTHQCKCKLATQAYKRIQQIKAVHKKLGIPRLGSNGQAISGSKTASGNTLLRAAPQTEFNHPGDLYEIRIRNSAFQADYLTLPSLVVAPLGAFNNFATAIQTGHLPTNDFLFESVNNIESVRQEVIKILFEPDLIIDVYRSTSGGWVIERPTSDSQMLTLRSVFVDNQLRVLNALSNIFFMRSLREYIDNILSLKNSSDLSIFLGQYADTKGNIAAFHYGAWTKLPSRFDRRLPQGAAQNPVPSNSLYKYSKIVRKPLKDINTKQGYYSSWNTLFKQGAEASASYIVGGIPLSRVYWFDKYLQSKHHLTFDDMVDLNFEQATANSIIAFDSLRPNELADYFTPLFKKRFFKAIKNQDNPTTDQTLTLNFLNDFEGRWFEGDRQQVALTNDVSDRFILASTWLLCFASRVLNPYLAGTIYEIGVSTPSDPLPTFNSFGVRNNIGTQANLLSRILGTAYDNTVFFDGWLAGQPSIDQLIIDSLNEALVNLGGFGARPWGAGRRGIYTFNNAILGPVASMRIFNASGTYFIAELGRCGTVKMGCVLPLGESGEVLGNPPGLPLFNSHNFDQLPIFTEFLVRPLRPFKKHKCSCK